MASQNEIDGWAPDLERFDEEWKKTSTSSDEMYSDIPDGIYDGIIEGAAISETTSTGRPSVIWKLRIKGPQAANRLITKNRVITENTLPYLKEDLEKCRIQVARLSELPSRLSELVDRPVRFEKSTKNGRTNIYFRRESVRISHDSLDDIPF